MTSSNEKPRLSIHFFYVALILISTIVLLATVKWTELPRFTDYLSTAATITSLVLGLLAIIYAYISNDSLSKSTGVVSEAANEAHEATAKISGLLNSISSLSSDHAETNERLGRILEDMKAQLLVLDGTTKTLDGQANAIASVLPEIPKGLDLIGRKFDEFKQTTPIVEPQTKSDELSLTRVDSKSDDVIRKSSPYGLLLMFACQLSKDLNKKFNIRTFSGDSDAGDYMRLLQNPERRRDLLSQSGESGGAGGHFWHDVVLTQTS